MLFLVGLPGQFLFGVTTMTMSAVVTTYLFGLLYFAATGTSTSSSTRTFRSPCSSGMHLLFTDPSTSPRTELGRIIFGVLYGLSTVALYAVLGSARAADVLRQAAAGAAPEPVDQGDRSRRAVGSAPATRPGAPGAMARGRRAPPRVHGRLGGRVHRR